MLSSPSTASGLSFCVLVLHPPHPRYLPHARLCVFSTFASVLPSLLILVWVAAIHTHTHTHTHMATVLATLRHMNCYPLFDTTSLDPHKLPSPPFQPETRSVGSPMAPTFWRWSVVAKRTPVTVKLEAAAAGSFWSLVLSQAARRSEACWDGGECHHSQRTRRFRSPLFTYPTTHAETHLILQGSPASVDHLLELAEPARGLGLDPPHRHAEAAVACAEAGQVGQAEQRCIWLGGLKVNEVMQRGTSHIARGLAFLGGLGERGMFGVEGTNLDGQEERAEGGAPWDGHRLFGHGGGEC